MEDWLTRAARFHGERVAIERDRSTRVTYAQLHQSASAAARRLAADGIGAGDRVALYDRDRLGFAAEVHACLRLGAVAVPIDPRLSAAEQAQRAAGGRLDEPAVATLMHTSGTTAAPKPVPLTHGNWEANAIGSALALGLDAGERWLCVMPLAHVGGLSILLRSTVYATTVVVHERFDSEAVLSELMDPERSITLVSLVPTMLARLLDAGLRRPPALRWALLGGGPIPAPLLARACDAGVPVAPSYGLTETCSQIATFGVPLHDAELRIDAGEVLVRGPSVAAAALADDGWLHTGDLGELDAAGRLRIIGRRAETIISGGENIAPAEVEAALLEHPAVADAGVFGRADPEWGEALTAAIVLRSPGAVDADQLREFVAARLAHFKVPRAFEFVEELPRTASGKLLRRDLAALSRSG